MRHLKAKKRLTFSIGNRKAIIRNLAKSVFRYKRITTTFGKAKAAQSFVERIITYAKKGGLQAYRLIESKIGDQRLVKRVVEEIAPHYKNRNGGYTRIIKAAPRRGDAAPMAVFELVGEYELKKFNPLRLKEKVKDTTKKDSETKDAKKEPGKKKVVKKVSVDKVEKPKEVKDKTKKEKTESKPKKKVVKKATKKEDK